MRRCGLVVCVIASVAPGLAQPWQTCYAVEGISYECGPGDSPKPFAQFVGGGVWKDVGSWGAHRIRIVHGASSSFVLVEGSRGIFAPLMQWRGSMPEVELHDVDGVKVLAMSRDFGGNVPMVSTWAWLWSDKGPVRLDVEGALAKAIDTVAPGHVGYQTGINWKTLRTGTGVWKGGYPGKIGVGLTVDVWFELNEDGLIPQKAEFRDLFTGAGLLNRWPKTTELQDAPLPPRSPCASPRGPEALADCVLRAAPPQEKYPAAEYPRHWQDALASVARSAGISSTAVDQAIRHWARQVKDPLQRGMAALYLQRPRMAIAPLRQAAEIGGGKAFYYLGRALYGERRFGEARIWFERAAALQPPDSALHWAWGSTLWEVMDFKGAELHLRRALAIRESESIPLLNYLSGTLYLHPDYAGIANLIQQALAIAEKQHGLDSPAYAEALHNSAVLHIVKLDPDTAEPMLRRALAVRQKRLGARHLETASTLEELGLLHYRRHNCKEAEPLFRQSLAIRQAMGAAHPSLAASYNAMGLCSEETGDQAAAEKWYRQALDLYTGLVGEDNAAAASYMCNLGYLTRSEPMLKRALEIEEALYGFDHTNLINVLNKLADVGGAMNGIPILQRAIAIREKASGPEHADLAWLLNNLAALFMNMRKDAEAEPVLERALGIYERSAGPAHADTKLVRERLSSVRKAVEK